MINKLIFASISLFAFGIANAETPATASQESQCLQSAISSGVPDQQLESYMEQCIANLQGTSQSQTSTDSGNN